MRRLNLTAWATGDALLGKFGVDLCKRGTTPGRNVGL